MGFAVDPPPRTSPASFMRSSNSLHGEPNKSKIMTPILRPSPTVRPQHPSSFHSSSPNLERQRFSSASTAMLPHRRIHSDFGIGHRRTRSSHRPQQDEMPQLPFSGVAAGGQGGGGGVTGAPSSAAQPQQGRVGRLERRRSHAVARGRASERAAPPGRRPLQPPGASPAAALPRRGPPPAGNNNMILVDEKDKRSYLSHTRALGGSVDSADNVRRRDPSTVVPSPTCVTKAVISPRNSKPVRAAPPPPPRQSLMKQQQQQNNSNNKYSPPPRRESQATATPKTLCSTDGGNLAAVSAMRSQLAKAQIVLPLTSSPQRRHMRNPSEESSSTLENNNHNRSSNSKLQMYPPPPPPRTARFGHANNKVNHVLPRRTSQQDQQQQQQGSCEENNNNGRSRKMTLSIDFLMGAASQLMQQQSQQQPQGTTGQAQQEMNPQGVEGFGPPSNYLSKTRRQLSQAQEVIALANPSSASASQHSRASQPQQPQPQPQGKTPSDEPEQHKGFRTDYVLGENARMPSHMVIEHNPSKAVELVDSLNNHDFAFIKRSDGTFSYAILAYRTNEAAAATSTPPPAAVVNSDNLDDSKNSRGSCSSPLEDSMTFVLSSSGCTKMIKKSQWAEFIRLVSSSTEEEDGHNKDALIEQEQQEASKVREELIEVKSDHDVEEYLAKLRREFYSTRPVTVGDGWLPPTTISWNDEEDDCISFVSTQSDLLALTDENGNRIGTVENARYVPSQPIILE